MQDQMVTGFELSQVQERLYTVSQGGDDAFQCQSALLIEGPLDVSRIWAVIEQTVSRYEILRTNFRLLSGRKRPVQVVQPSPEIAFETADFSGAGSGDAQCARVEQYLREQREHPLDLANDPLTRFRLVTLGADRHLLVLTLSSLCGDAQTLALLADEIFSLYQGTGETVEEPLQYADFSAWQRDLVQSEEEDARQAREFWRKEEADAQPLQELPYERRTAGAIFVPETVVVPLPASLSAALTDFLLASWLSVCFRVTHQEEGVVGIVVNGRAYEELATAPGFFVKTLPLRWKVNGETPFEQVVSQIGEATEQAEARQDHYSPASAVESEGIKDALLGFTWETRFSPKTIGDAKISLYRQHVVTDRFGLNLVCGLARGAVTAEIQYDAGRFAKEDILRLAAQFALLAQGAAETPTALVGELPLLPAAERNRLVKEWNATETEYPRDACIHYLFEQQAARTPNAPALVCAGERFTFAELNAKANQIAHLLREKGAGPNRPVALCAERSADMIIGLLAILKAGGFYVPLAADLPAVRLQGLLDQTETTLALTQKPLREKFSGWDGALIALDADAAQWTLLPTTDPEHRNSPDDLTYVIFTSGSTGVPKGVGNRHRGLVNYTAYIAARIGLATATEPLHFGTVTTLSADLGNTSVFPSLAYGGCLHVIGYETAMDGERFGSYLRDNPLDFLKITPSHLSALLASSENNILPRKHLFLGGEAFTWDLLKQAQGRGSCQIVNHYGPTETTIGSLTYTATGGAGGPDDSATVPIGRPIANTRIYILDERGQPVPIGVSGELYIGGAGLASGYLNQPERTAERFVPDPFVGGGERMYRTGDRVRYLSCGGVEFLGRRDDQVKIRGFRVEPGEVESVLRRHPNVREAVVLVTEDNQGAKRLTGFYVAASSDSAGGTMLREYLSDNLPEYMIPSGLTALSELPLTPNGKIDRKALLSQEGAAAAVAYEAGRNPTEVKLAEIWAQILKVERVGIHEDFFALGGHSLLMTQILARIRSIFQVQLGLHTLFDNPTIASLAAIIDGEQMTDSEEEEMRLLLAELEGLSEDEVNELLSAELK